MEFAIALPILLALLAGAFELGRAFFVRQTAISAVRSGARFLARIPDPTCTPTCSRDVLRAVAQAAQRIADGTGLPSASIRVSPTWDSEGGTVAMRADCGLSVDLLRLVGLSPLLTVSATHRSAGLSSDPNGQDGGAALVEAALVLPILLLLVLGLVDVSLYFWTLSLAEKAVQLGARRAIVSDPVAVGPGLDAYESAAFWAGLSPGERCDSGEDTAPRCPTFTVTCDLGLGCRCTGSACQFRLAVNRLDPILAAMQAVMPQLKSQDLRISYTTNGLGYVGRPGPVAVDVRVSLIGLTYDSLFLRDLVRGSLRVSASAGLPGESLLSRR